MMNTETESLLKQHYNDQELGYGGIPSITATTANNSHNDDCLSNTEASSSQIIMSEVVVTAAIQKRQKRLLLAMALLLPYIGLVISLLVANNFDQDTVIEKYYFLPFHRYEFWGSVYFALVEGYVLLVADESSFVSMDQTSQSILVHMLSINIVSSTVAAALFTLHSSIFEVPAHFIEYSSQLTVTLIDAYFMILPRNGSKHLRDRRKMGDQKIIPIWVQQGYFVLLVLADIFKFVLYTKLIPTAIGGERSSHYVEFTVELLNSLWAFMYIKDLYMQSLWQNHQGVAQQQ